ncbi:hypothetical protein U0035_22800 [Niabella yanshanensis]|uniref:Uncharacterized protein n=1 Tax=Niabella yanshanensis TaxID=577386 RepID=A0ABZ0W5V7_9BACT|nr:hypothetical protein [Niabella yanshanensis]WQD38506.1 hypothetical protein U0035_22800 [Niabella yanshanensis]
MRKQLNYDELLHTMRLSNSDDPFNRGTLLLTLVHEVMEEKSLNKQDFIFTQYDEGYILITQVNT